MLDWCYGKHNVHLRFRFDPLARLWIMCQPRLPSDLSDEKSEVYNESIAMYVFVSHLSTNFDCYLEGTTFRHTTADDSIWRNVVCKLCTWDQHNIRAYYQTRLHMLQNWMSIMFVNQLIPKLTMYTSKQWPSLDWQDNAGIRWAESGCSEGQSERVMCVLDW